MHEVIHLLPRRHRAVVLGIQLCLGLCTLFLLFWRLSWPGNVGVPFVVITYVMAGFLIVALGALILEVWDPNQRYRKRTLRWDDKELVQLYRGKEKVIRWDAVRTVVEDQISFHLYSPKTWRSFGLIKFGLPPELTQKLRERVEEVKS